MGLFDYAVVDVTEVGLKWSCCKREQSSIIWLLSVKDGVAYDKTD